MTRKEKRNRQILVRLVLLLLALVVLIIAIIVFLALINAKNTEAKVDTTAKIVAYVSSKKAQDEVREERILELKARAEARRENAKAKAKAKAEKAKTRAKAKAKAEAEAQAAAEAQAWEESQAWKEAQVPSYNYNGDVLNSYNGMIAGPSGTETYYNLPMEGVIGIMRESGFSEEEYPYWVRDDGVKMLGDYVMVAADFGIRPLGTLVDSSLGTGIVCDTGTFIYTDPYQLDIAVTW